MEQELRILPSDNRHKIFAEKAVKENPKLVEQYFAGRGGVLSQLVEYTKKISLYGDVNDNLVGECIVLELMELYRSRLRVRKEGR